MGALTTRVAASSGVAMRRGWALVVATVAVGCTFTIPSNRYVCDDDGDCPEDFSCVAALCVADDVDAGAGMDAGSDRDAGAEDAGGDAGVSDPCSWGTFDGDGYVSIPASEELVLPDGDHTVEAWVRLDAGQPRHAVITVGQLSFSILPNSLEGDIEVGVVGNSRLRSTRGRGQVGDGRWHHVAYSYAGEGYDNPDNWRFWVDGLPVGGIAFSLEEGEATIDPLPASGETTIGREPSADGVATLTTRGEMRELRISSSVRYTEAFVPEVNLPADATTLALWRLSDATAAEVPDAVGGLDGANQGVVGAGGACPRTCRIEEVHFQPFDGVRDMAWADYDGDGDDDLAIGFTTGQARVYTNDGMLGLPSGEADWIEPGVTAPCGSLTGFSDTVLDWGSLGPGGDGRLALAVGHRRATCCDSGDDCRGRDGFASVFQVDDEGALPDAPNFSTGFSDETDARFVQRVRDVALADANADGWADLFVASDHDCVRASSVSRIWSGGDAGIETTALWANSVASEQDYNVEAWMGMGAADPARWIVDHRAWTCDGTTPTSDGSGKVRVRHPVLPEGPESLALEDREEFDAYGFVLGDLNGDGYDDLILNEVIEGVRQLVAHLYDPAAGMVEPLGRFAEEGVVIDASWGYAATRHLALGDVDGDGDLDLVGQRLRSSSSGARPFELALWLNDVGEEGEWQLRRAWEWRPDARAETPLVTHFIDWDRDGSRDDIATSSRSSPPSPPAGCESLDCDGTERCELLPDGASVGCVDNGCDMDADCPEGFACGGDERCAPVPEGGVRVYSRVCYD